MKYLIAFFVVVFLLASCSESGWDSAEHERWLDMARGGQFVTVDSSIMLFSVGKYSSSYAREIAELNMQGALSKMDYTLYDSNRTVKNTKIFYNGTMYHYFIEARVKLKRKK